MKNQYQQWSEVIQKSFLFAFFFIFFFFFFVSDGRNGSKRVEEKKKDLIINQQEIMGWNQAERDGNLQKSTSWNTERDQQTHIAPLPHCNPR